MLVSLKKICKLSVAVLKSVICLESLDLSSFLTLHSGYVSFDAICDHLFGLYKHDNYFSQTIVNDGDEVAAPIFDGHWATEIQMYQFVCIDCIALFAFNALTETLCQFSDVARVAAVFIYFSVVQTSYFIASSEFLERFVVYVVELAIPYTAVFD